MNVKIYFLNVMLLLCSCTHVSTEQNITNSSTTPKWASENNILEQCQAIGIASLNNDNAERIAILKASAALSQQRKIWVQSKCTGHVETRTHQGKETIIKNQYTCKSMLDTFEIAKEKPEIIDRWEDDQNNHLYLLLQDNFCYQ